LLWADDNGPSSGGAPFQEGTYTIDNLQIGQAFMPAIIPEQPHDITVEQGRTTNLTVHAVGTTLHYQWFKNGAAIPNATNSILMITNAQLQDSGTYFVRVDSGFPFSSCGEPSSAESRHVTVTVNADTTQPVVLQALGRLNKASVVVTFSEPIAPSSVDWWGFELIGGGEVIYVDQTRIISDSEFELITSAPLGPVNYQLFIDPSVSDPQGNPLAETTVPLAMEVPLLTIEDTPWKYNHEGVDLGTAWRRKAYDDGSWSNGTTILNASILPLHFGSYSVDDVPVYYFRTHFQVPTIPGQVAELRLRTRVDDFDVAWLNGYDAPVHVHSGYTNSNVDVYGYGGGTAIVNPSTLPVNGFYQINPTNLFFGDNLMAVKLFQASATSSDISFAYELTAIVNRFVIHDSHLQIDRHPSDPERWLLSWDVSAGRLYESSDIAAPQGAWTLVTDAEAGSYLIPAGAVSKFYTIRP
jgi:hypothetical protein